MIPFTTQPTPDMAPELSREYWCLNARINQLTNMLETIAKQHGPIAWRASEDSETWVCVDNRQTIRQEMPNLRLWAETLPEFVSPDDFPAYFLAALNAIDSRSIKKFIYGLPVAPEISAKLAALDADGGQVTEYSKPLMAVRTTPPGDEHHVVLPGTMPLVSETAPVENDPEDYDDYMLSPGD